MKVDVSIVICTYNRSESLKDTLARVQEQNVSDHFSLEIIVVDNNSTDATGEVVSEAQKHSRWPLRYIFESVQGLSRARNCGARSAQGELIAFTDDDVLPASDWIQELWRAFQKFNVDFLGGPIALKWEVPPPSWLLDKRFQHHLAALDQGSEAIVTDKINANFIYGGNMAFRAGTFEDIGYFRIDMGPGTSNPLGRGEDTEMIERAFRKGKRAAYIPSALVYHKVCIERMNLEYLRRWWRSAGEGYVQLSGKFSRVSFWLIREWLAHGLSACFHYGLGKKLEAIHAEQNFWYKFGMIKMLLKGNGKTSCV